MTGHSQQLETFSAFQIFLLRKRLESDIRDLSIYHQILLRSEHLLGPEHPIGIAPFINICIYASCELYFYDTNFYFFLPGEASQAKLMLKQLFHPKQ